MCPPGLHPCTSPLPPSPRSHSEGQLQAASKAAAQQGFPHRCRPKQSAVAVVEPQLQSVKRSLCLFLCWPWEATELLPASNFLPPFSQPRDVTNFTIGGFAPMSPRINSPMHPSAGGELGGRCTAPKTEWGRLPPHPLAASFYIGSRAAGRLNRTTSGRGWKGIGALGTRGISVHLYGEAVLDCAGEGIPTLGLRGPGVAPGSLLHPEVS